MAQTSIWIYSVIYFVNKKKIRNTVESSTMYKEPIQYVLDRCVVAKYQR